MTKNNELYKCNVCGNVVSVLESGQGVLVCCNQPMNLLEEKHLETEGNEKHVPVITIEGNKVSVNVGSVDHPMESEHHISLIQVMRGTEVIAGKRLKPGDKPHAEFNLENTEGLRARAYCNLHGLWRSK